MRYLLLILLLISKTATADCYIVTNLMTYWQSRLNVLGIPVGDFKDKVFSITVSEEKVSVYPGRWDCIAHGKQIVDCGENVKLVTLNDKEIEQLTSSSDEKAPRDPKKYVYMATEGNIKQNWHLMPEENQVYLTVPKSNKSIYYKGVIKGKC